MEPVSDPLIDILNNTTPRVPAYVPPAVADSGPDGLFEVHFWPYTGRVMTVHLADDTARTTDLRIVGTGGRGSKHLSDQTAALAEHLANNSNPQGSLVEHWTDGAVTYLWDRPGDPTDTFDMRSAADDLADGQDLHFDAAGISLPDGTLTVARVQDLTGGARRAQLLRNRRPIGSIIQPAGGRAEFTAAHPAERAQLTADLIAFARNCRGRDGGPVTLGEVLAALIDEHTACQ